ncbi:unnamed protein product [Coregonus sp. 'balchen']|nr:unnamed protein product [Coregonus sp. 'balchen']
MPSESSNCGAFVLVMPFSGDPIFEAFSYVCNKTVDPDPFTAIFGIPPLDCTATTHQANAVAFASLLARRLILFNWKTSARPPSLTQGRLVVAGDVGRVGDDVLLGKNPKGQGGDEAQCLSPLVAHQAHRALLHYPMQSG